MIHLVLEEFADAFDDDSSISSLESSSSINKNSITIVGSTDDDTTTQEDDRYSYQVLYAELQAQQHVENRLVMKIKELQDELAMRIARTKKLRCMIEGLNIDDEKLSASLKDKIEDLQPSEDSLRDLISGMEDDLIIQRQRTIRLRTAVDEKPMCYIRKSSLEEATDMGWLP